MGEADRSRQSDAIYALQMREAVMRMTLAGMSLSRIAADLGQSVSTIGRYRQQARLDALRAQQAPEITYDLRGDLPPDPARSAKRGAGPGPHVRFSWKRPSARLDPPDEPTPPRRRPVAEVNMDESTTSADLSASPPSSPAPPRLSRAMAVVDPASVLDPPDIVQLRSQCLDLRKAMRTFPEIAQMLGISEAAARAHTAYALRSLQDSVTTSADLERRLMVEQIDDMIRAIRPQTVGSPEKEPVLDAIDRMLKLMDRKAKLLGLDQAESVDIMIRLQALATEGNYDMMELMDLAKDTLSKHRIRMPLHLVAGSTEDDDGGAAAASTSDAAT